MPPKKKQEKMSLGNFLSDQSLGSWADEMEDMPVPSGDSRGYNRDGPRREYNVPDFGAARDRDAGGMGGDRPGYQTREPLPLPTRPPYTAHLGNLSFDVTSADVEGLFADCQVTNVRLVEDRIERKPKGFGYVEFATLDGLKQALTFSNSQFQGRNIRVSVADPPKDRPEGRELNDWTRKGPLPDLPNRRPSDRGFRSFDAGSDAGSERSMSRKGFGADGGDGKVRDFGNWERKGPLSPVPGAATTAAPGGREGGRPSRDPSRSFERRDSPSWGEGRPASDPSKAPRPAPERQPTAADLDTQWRARMKPDAPASPTTATPDPSTPTSPVATAPTVRPKLNLQKRTVSEAPQDAAASGAADAKASPFGAARPIDSAQREREIEEKRLALRQKKDEEDKAAEAKKQADKATKADSKTERTASSKNSQSQENGKPAPKDKENGAAPQTQAGRQYEILRRMNEGEEEAEDTVETNGTIAEDNQTKPKEVVRDRTTGEKTQSTTEGLEEEGWSTVPAAKGRGKRAGGTTGRALAS